MKVHKQKKHKRITTCLLALAIIITTTFSNNISVYASPSVSAEKAIDIALTKTGIVANDGLLTSIKQKISDYVNQINESYENWLEENSTTRGKETFEQWRNSNDYPFEKGSVPDWIASKLVDSITFIATGVTDIVSILLDWDNVRNEGVVDSDTVKYVKRIFDDSASDLGYFYINTLTMENVNPNWFKTKDAYDALEKIVVGSDGYFYFRTINEVYDTYTYMGYGADNTLTAIQYELDYFEDVNFVGAQEEGINHQYWYTTYNDNWETQNSIRVSYIPRQGKYLGENLEEYKKKATTGESYVACTINRMSCDGYGKMHFSGIITSDGRAVRVYKNVESMKSFSIKAQPYYVVTNNNYDETVDNSVTISGDYITKYGNTTNYSTVQNNIDNTTDSTENNINNIVNNTTTVITNNYYYTTGDDSASDGDSTGNGSDSGNGLANVIKALGELLNFLLNAIAEVISTIAGVLNGLLEILKSLGSVFSAFSGLMGELFSFIPSDVISLLTASMYAVVGICLWRFFKK